MVYFCKSYSENGEIEHRVIHNSLDEAQKWGEANARTEKGNKYSTAIYYVKCGVPFDVFHPGEPFKVTTPK